MTDVTHEEVRDMLPGLLHDRLDAVSREAVEAHVNSCDSCRAELRALRAVKSAPLFEPSIDAAKISARIPPYGGVIRGGAAVRRTYLQIGMLLAATLVLAVALIVPRRHQVQSPSVRQVARAVTLPAKVSVTAPPSSGAPAMAAPGAVAPAVSGNSAPAVARQELQLAAGLDGVSDRSVARLLRELDKMDALPSTEPEPIGLSEGDSAGFHGGEQ